jgi:hypothetical protein
MKLAIMQPYLFPYIGYFQLMNTVDKFVIYDDVSYINRGWVNRNKILVNGKGHMFTVPLKNASQNVLIKDLELIVSEKWKNKFLKTLEHAYGKAPFFEEVFSIVYKVTNTKSKFIKDWHLKSFRLINNYLGIDTIIVESSSIYKNKILKGQNRILDICIKEKTNQYINPIGGKELYNSELFMNHEIKLNFLKTEELYYNQFSSEFVPWLSMIDVMMFNKSSSTKDMLSKYKLTK